MLWHRLDVPRTRGVIAELLANVLDALSQRRVGHEHAVPYLFKDLLLLDQLTAAAHKQQEHIEVFRVEGDGLAVAREVPVAGVEMEVVEAITASRRADLTHRLNLLTT